MKIYTGTGDGGKTSLFSGERISKDDERIEAYGTVDELNSIVGAVAASLPGTAESSAVRDTLTRIQSDLFRVGAILATTSDSTAASYLRPIEEEQGRWLEAQVDEMQSRLTDLTAFILPGGHPSAAWSHIARAVCRRAERRIVALAGHEFFSEENGGALLTYINRLSDYLFVLARYCNFLAGVDDQPWNQ